MDASMSYLRQFVPDGLAAVSFVGGPRHGRPAAGRRDPGPAGCTPMTGGNAISGRATLGRDLIEGQHGVAAASIAIAPITLPCLLTAPKREHVSARIAAQA